LIKKININEFLETNPSLEEALAYIETIATSYNEVINRIDLLKNKIKATQIQINNIIQLLANQLKG